MKNKYKLLTIILFLLFTVIAIHPRDIESSNKQDLAPGVIKAVGKNYIDVYGYGRFLVSPEEAVKLKQGEHAPKYILKRGS